MLASIYGQATRRSASHLRDFVNGIFDYYVNTDSEFDNGDTESTVLHFLYNIQAIDYDILKRFYQLAYYKGKEKVVASCINQYFIGTGYIEAKAQGEIDAAVGKILILEKVDELDSKFKRTTEAAKARESEINKAKAKLFKMMTNKNYSSLNFPNDKFDAFLKKEMKRVASKEKEIPVAKVKEVWH